MSGTPRILFVADAGAKVGGGHVMRCLTLAEALVEKGAVCAFAATPAAIGVLTAFARAPIEVVAAEEGLSSAELARAGAFVAGDWGAGAIVADHYGFGPAEDALLAAASPLLLIIDDLRRRHAEGVVLDPSIGRSTKDYPGRELLAGPEYGLVRPEFAQRRAAALRRRRRQATPGRVLVSLGLTDAGAITGRVVRAILPALGEARLDVVIGGEAPSRRELEVLAGGEPRMALHVDVRDMATLTARADIAIGAGGSSVWERAVLGLPSLTVVVADNQRENARALAQAGAALVIAPPSADFDHRLRAGYRSLAGDAALRAAMSRAAAALCDGRGAERVAARLLAG